MHLREQYPEEKVMESLIREGHVDVAYDCEIHRPVFSRLKWLTCLILRHVWLHSIRAPGRFCQRCGAMTATYREFGL